MFYPTDRCRTFSPWIDTTRGVQNIDRDSSRRFADRSSTNLKSVLFHNPATANDFVAAIENRCLSGRDRALPLVEFYVSTRVAQWSNRCRRGRVAITHSYFGLNRFVRIVKGNPIYARGHERIAR